MVKIKVYRRHLQGKNKLEGENKLEDLQCLNTFHPNLKLTHTKSKTSVNF